MMKVDKFVSTLKEIEKQPTVYYSKAGGAWCAWNGKSWNMDCVCMIKGVLWGFDFNKQASHGGAVYGSNGVYDDDANGILKRCYDVSANFENIEVGELMHMDGHVGIYIGNRKVVEATAAWDYKVQISDVGNNGRRSKNGVDAGYWKEHGKLQYVDYSQPAPSPIKYKVGDIVNIDGVYVSSTSNEKLTPAITRGTITRIVDGARNPYLLDDGNIGWVNNDCIISVVTIEYYPAFNNTSIVDGLKSIGVDSSFENRTRIANKNGIENYRGTSEQNIRLLNLAKNGKLIRA